MEEIGDFFKGIMVLSMGAMMGMLLLTGLMKDDPTYKDGYCEAINSKYTFNVGCIKDDKIIYKFKK